jgi:hypothetical protein
MPKEPGSRNHRWRRRSEKLHRHVLSILFFAICLVSATASPVVPNPDFEQVQIACPPPSPFRSCVSASPSDIPGWTHSGAIGDGLIWHVGYSDATGSATTAGSGNQFVTMGGGEFVSAFASWSTVVTGLTPGTISVLSFLMASEGINASQSLTATLSDGAVATGNFTAPVSSANYWRIWVPQTLQFAPTGSSATLTFSATTNQDVGLDAVAVTALIPEPGTLGLLALGLFCAITCRRVLCKACSGYE